MPTRTARGFIKIRTAIVCIFLPFYAVSLSNSQPLDHSTPGETLRAVAYDFTVVYGQDITTFYMTTTTVPLSQQPHTTSITFGNFSGGDFLLLNRTLTSNGVTKYTETWEFDIPIRVANAQVSTDNLASGNMLVDWETGDPVAPSANFEIIRTQSQKARDTIEADLEALLAADPNDITFVRLNPRGDCAFIECCVLNNGPDDPDTGNFNCSDCCAARWPHPNSASDCSGATDIFLCCIAEANADYCERLCENNAGSLLFGLIDTAACAPGSIFKWIFG